MKKKSYKSNPFSSMQGAAVGMAGLGITTGVVAGIDSMAPAGTPKMSAGMNTMAGFVPVMGTAVGGMAVLKQVKKIKKGY